MGSSVFHGGFSTFIAVALMGFAKLYTFKVFFKTWLVILFFGILNGIILLPILLSMVGPVEVQEPVENSQEELDQELGKK